VSDVTTASGPGAAVSPPAARAPESVRRGGQPAPGQPSRAKRLPQHSKPGFSSVTLFTAYLVLLLLIPSNLVFAPMGGVGTPANIVALGILLWYVVSWIVGRVVPSGAGRPVRISMFIFALAVLASFVAAMTRSITELEILSADRGLILIVAFAALVVVASQTIVSYERLDTLLRRAVALGSVVAAIGIAEFYTGLNITNYIHIPGLSPAVDVNTLLSRNGFNRPSSTATQPIEFGVVMAMLLPFALQQAFDPTRIGRFRKWAPVLLLFFAIPMSLSRSGIVGLAIALLWIIPTWPPPRRKPAWVVLLIGIASLKVVAPGLIGTFLEYFGGLSGSSNSDVSISTRTADYAAAFRYIAERPLFGRGFSTFLPELYRYTDNTYLLGLVEFGIVGVLSLLIVYFAGIHCAAAGRRLTQDQRQRELGQALTASIMVAVVSSATFDALTFPMFSGLLFLIIGCAGAYLGLMRAQAQGPARGLMTGRAQVPAPALMTAQAPGQAAGLMTAQAPGPAVSGPGSTGPASPDPDSTGPASPDPDSTGAVSPGGGRQTRPPALPHPFFGPSGGETLRGRDRQRADHTARGGDS
jgi:O-antigen ligase